MNFYTCLRLTFLKKNATENVYKSISELLDFKNFWGWGACPQTPLAARAFGAGNLPRLVLKSGYGPGLHACLRRAWGAKSKKIIKAVRGLPEADNYLLFPFCVMRDTCIYFVVVVSHLRLFFRPRGASAWDFLAKSWSRDFGGFV